MLTSVHEMHHGISMHNGINKGQPHPSYHINVVTFYTFTSSPLHLMNQLMNHLYTFLMYFMNRHHTLHASFTSRAVCKDVDTDLYFITSTSDSNSATAEMAALSFFDTSSSLRLITPLWVPLSGGAARRRRTWKSECHEGLNIFRGI